MWSNLQILVVAPQFAVGLLIEGLLIGSIFALVAYGLALVWGVMNVKNLAQGPMVITGGYVCWYLSTLGIHPLIGIALQRTQGLAQTVGMTDIHRFLRLGYQAIQPVREIHRFVETVILRERDRLDRIYS